MFAREREDGETIAVKIDRGAREALVAMQPGTFVVTPHYENHPWVIVRLASVDPQELAELLTEAWRMTAARRTRERFDAERAPDQS
jgi:hypothetical protein